MNEQILAAPVSPVITWGVPAVVATLVVLRELRRKRRAGESLSGAPVVPRHPVLSPDSGGESAGRSQSWGEVIESIRRRAGSPPREFDPQIARYLTLVPPTWLGSSRDKALSRPYERQRAIRRDGAIVWATLVQANNLLFQPGPLDHPASIIYAEDGRFDADPSKLRKIAGSLFELKGSQQADPEAAEFAKVLTDERIRAPRLRVPTRFAGSAEVYHTSIIIPRKHLPIGYMTRNTFPIWVDPKRDGSTLLVPAAFWPAPLIREWRPKAIGG